MSDTGHPAAQVIDLDGAWSFAVSDRRLPSPVRGVDDLVAAGLNVLPASVPGTLELDLLANGLIDDPFVGLNVVGLRRYERSFVYYVRTFAAPAPGERDAFLAFDGIDCFARVVLNGIVVGETDNMLIGHRIAVGAALLPGVENVLCVEIEPAVDRARAAGLDYPPGLRADPTSYESLYVRKAPHMYGWDIMPRAVSAGIWRSVSLQLLPRTRFDWAWLETESIASDRSLAQLVLHYRTLGTDVPGDWTLRVAGACGDARLGAERALLFDAGALRFAVAEPALWWPRGRGPADLYDVTVELLRDGLVVDTVRLRHGIRTVELRRTSVTTAAGDGDFSILVNGERIFILGTNWVPLDAYHARDRERLARAVGMVVDLGCNLVRCWGGNVYEDDRFFEECDEAGILVWQDFAMACAVYPQDERFGARLRDEARAVVRRLRQHPSLALWAGDNECDETWVWTGGRRRDPNQNVLTRSVLPAVLREEDPSRPYLPSSPYVDDDAFESGRRLLPEDHLWGPRDDYKGAFYTESVCHFVSEIGFQGCPDVESLERYLTPGERWPFEGSEEWRLHSTAPLPGVAHHDYRVALMATQVRNVFGEVPDDLATFVEASQAVQAEALKFFIDLFRAGKWRRTGIIWWNLIDGWPQVSDAVVDYYFVKKPAYDAVKLAQAAVSVIVREAVDGLHEVVVANDTREDVELTFAVYDIDRPDRALRGTALAGADVVTRLGGLERPAGEQRFYVLEWQSRLGRGRGHYLAGPPPFSLSRYREWRQRARAGSRDDGPDGGTR
jgi:beta-mannosidase